MKDSREVCFENVALKSFVDMPSAIPEIQIPLQRVGVTNRPLSVTLLDPLTSQPGRFYGDLSVMCTLIDNQRGIHMSRIEEAIDEIRDSGFAIKDFVGHLAKLVAKTQAQDYCEIDLEIRGEHRVSKNPSGKSSVELLNFSARACVNKDHLTNTIGITVPFINACPCTQRWAMREFYQTLQDRGYDKETAAELVRCAPLQAHTNKGTAAVKVTSESVTHLDLYGILDRSVPIIRELLKGCDEHALVSVAHRHGQFCEDNIRAIVREFVSTFSDKLEDSAQVEVSVEVDESVHYHNLCSSMTDTFGGLKGLF